MKDLSVLIPTYNTACVSLVKALQRQAAALGIGYEIIVADDGSTDVEAIEENRSINQIEHCRVIIRSENCGRAAIRNFLASQARYSWLLFIDSDMVVCSDGFLQQYVQSEGYDVVDGGVRIGKVQTGNLRSIYEKASEKHFTAEKRSQSTYRDFHTANFMIRRDLMLLHPFDERFRHYGYEDVLFGKTLELQGIPILHLDNPLSFEVFESNPDFVSKTEEGLRTLYLFRDELQGYSRLLTLAQRLTPVIPLIRLWHRIFGGIERRQLTGSHPSLTIFNLYRIGYFISIKI
jgi:glycosyltransferase involved in cell wall biosynthesis